MKIIVIEKNRDLLRKITILLEVLGYYVISVSSKKEFFLKVNFEKGDKLLIRLNLKNEDLSEKKELTSFELVSSLRGKLTSKEDIFFFEETDQFNQILKGKIEVRGRLIVFSKENPEDLIKKITQTF